MEIVYDLLVVAHFLGLATLIGGVLADLRRQPLHVSGLPLTGAWIQVLTGIALTGLASADLAGTPPDNAKIAVKLVVALVVLGVVYAARRGIESRATTLLRTAGLLAVANVFVAALW